MPIGKLRGFYDTFYWPDNATVSVIGDIKPDRALALVKKYYGVYSKAPNAIPQVYTEEPAQSGPRRVTVKRAGELGVVGISYKSPAATHADMAALNVLGSILSSGKTSRFYRGLTDKNLTTSVSADPGFYHDPSLFQVYAYLAPGAGHEQVEKILRDEIARITTDGVADTEVATAVRKISANIAYARDGTSAVAAVLNEWIAAGDWTLYSIYPERVSKVIAADVKRVANVYLVEDQSTTGWFVPVVSQ